MRSATMAWKGAHALTDTPGKYTFTWSGFERRNAVNPAARVTARVLTACAVLVGLAFMHGLGAAIGTGCPGGHDAATVEATTTAMPDLALLATPPHSAGHGTACVTTPPRGEPTGPVALAGKGLGEPAVLEQPSLGIPRVGGAVPRAGPALLISLCVSRT